MPGPARAGLLIYAKHTQNMSRFYEELFDMRILVADQMHHIVENDDIQVIIHAIPAHIAEHVRIAVPPELREEQAFKPFFTVTSLVNAEERAQALGGFSFGPTWDGPGFTMRNLCDPEGNIVQVRAFT
ncbi:MAG: hypothetical protein IT353_03380 [Gemmatimonadaceae bacterium]|nr:hypothetical protein [Gemmatimonadaceae bacterium]